MLNSAQKIDAKDEAASPPAETVADDAAIERRKVIEATIQSIRPNLQRDKGDCELIDVQGDKVFVKMTGACVGCQLSSMTLNGVQAKLVEATGRMIRVIPVGGNLPHL
ncbi:NifU family protein [Methylocapsa acidiphila]|uniref:NifU family protein n=1 Tax=Methylocapsa acidiphila TaxID=133552 RepID=UPI00047E5FC5|nr:NifU family protein [Methylocapsa acidiphila]